ncbi:MAG: hypothetical protein K8U57_00370 [Planctomycetes bacterium]|nr:hypothetical protein [Planctomycetota bacterium]
MSRRSNVRSGFTTYYRPLLEILQSRLAPATLTVNTLLDVTNSGLLSLRDAIATINGGPAAFAALPPSEQTQVNLRQPLGTNDTINFASGLTGAIDLGTVGDRTFGPSAFLVSKPMKIDGNNGAAGITIDRTVAAPTMRLFAVSAAGNLTLDSLTLSNGLAQGGTGGDGLNEPGGGAGLGGAIFNAGSLSLVNSTLSGNQAVGGAVGGRNATSGGSGGGGGLGGNGGDANPLVGGGNNSGGGGGGTQGNGGNGVGLVGGAGGAPTGGAGGMYSAGGNATGFGGGGGGAGAGNPGYLGGAGGFGGGAGGGRTTPPTPSGNGGFGGGASRFSAQPGFGGGGLSGEGGGGAGMGGAIFNLAGSVTITNSTLTGNTAQGGSGISLQGPMQPFAGGSGFGGAVFNLNGSLTVQDSTLAANSVVIGANRTSGPMPFPIAKAAGGGIYNLAFPALQGVPNSNPASTTLVNSILSGSIGGAELVNDQQVGSGGATITATAPNLVQTQSNVGGGTINGGGIIAAPQPLGPLQNNGGPTQTMSLLDGPAINGGNNALIPPGVTTDQRGLPRINNGTVDLGAVEVLLPTGGSTPAKLMSVTSSTGSGKYNAGDTINVTVNFDQPVTLTGGNLIVNLNDGATVTISPFSNSTHASGTYTVAPGQNTQSLDSVSLVVSGGTLRDANGNTIAPTIPPGHSLSSSVNLLIDTTPPTVTIETPSVPAATSGPVSYTIFYADTNFNTSTLAAADITLNKTGTANGTVSVSGGVGVSRTVTINNITGTGTLGISLAAGTASDTAGNLAPVAGPSATFNVVNVEPDVAAFAVGGSNGTVRLLNATGTLIQSVTPISGYTGLVSVALGNFNSDSVPDLAVTAANPAGVAGLTTAQAGKVFVYDGDALAKGTLTLIRTFTPFTNHDGPDGGNGVYTNGLNIAAGDVNGDGHVDLIAGTRGGSPTAGQDEIGRLVVINGVSEAIIGGIQTPFGAGYQKGVIVAAGNVDGIVGDEIAVTRGGPVASPNPAVQSIKVKVLQLQGTALTELPLNADGSTAFAPFAGLPGAAKGISRDGRVAFVDSNGDFKAELVFTALDPLTTPTNGQVRVGVYNIDPTASKGAATIASAGPDAGTYLTGTAVTDHAITHVAGTGLQQNLALLTQSASSGIVYLAPLTGATKPGGFSLNIVTGGITIDGI